MSKSLLHIKALITALFSAIVVTVPSSFANDAVVHDEENYYLKWGGKKEYPCKVGGAKKNDCQMQTLVKAIAGPGQTDVLENPSAKRESPACWRTGFWQKEKRIAWCEGFNVEVAEELCNRNCNPKVTNFSYPAKLDPGVVFSVKLSSDQFFNAGHCDLFGGFDTEEKRSNAYKKFNGDLESSYVKYETEKQLREMIAVNSQDHVVVDAIGYTSLEGKNYKSSKGYGNLAGLINRNSFSSPYYRASAIYNLELSDCRAREMQAAVQDWLVKRYGKPDLKIGTGKPVGASYFLPGHPSETTSGAPSGPITSGQAEDDLKKMGVDWLLDGYKSKMPEGTSLEDRKAHLKKYTISDSQWAVSSSSTINVEALNNAIDGNTRRGKNNKRVLDKAKMEANRRVELSAHAKGSMAERWVCEKYKEDIPDQNHMCMHIVKVEECGDQKCNEKKWVAAPLKPNCEGEIKNTCREIPNLFGNDQ